MIPAHVVIDGSNIATEGRSQPSLRQLREAVAAFAAEHPTAKLSIVVDATFGHRIDPSEVAEFDAAVANNELVAPPAGAIGRGDAFVLGIADKVNAVILSNDSYQEFHGQYDWLFDEGRLVGGKPVPHVGWVFVNRLPVRGPLSRKSVSEAKRKGRRNTGPTARDGDGTVRVGSAEASKPMPVPKSPPPGAVLAGAAAPAKGSKAAKAAKSATAAKAAKGASVGRGAAASPSAAGGRRGAKGDAPPSPAAATDNSAARSSSRGPLNDFVEYLGFVERHPIGTPVRAVIDHYSSHGAYVRVDGLLAYVPLRLMADPAPRSAREFAKLGETVDVVVHQYHPATRSVDLAVPSLAVAADGGARRGAAGGGLAAGLRKVAGSTGRGTTKGAAKSVEKASSGRAATRGAKAAAPASTKKAATASAATAKKASPKKASAAPAAKAPAKKAPAKKVPAKKVPAKKGATKKAPATTAPTKKATVTTSPAKKGAIKSPAKSAAKKTPAKKASATKAASATRSTSAR